MIRGLSHARIRERLSNWRTAKTFARHRGAPGWAHNLPEDARTVHTGTSSRAQDFQDAFSRVTQWGGWSTSHACIMEIVKTLHGKPPRSYLEIGVNEGLSVFALATAVRLQRILHRPDSLDVALFDQLVLADNWGADFGGTGRRSHDHVAALLRALQISPTNVVFLDGDSKTTVPAYLDSRQDKLPFDAIYVDGDHTHMGAWRDLSNVLPYVGDMLFFDDMYHPAHCTADKLIELHIGLVEMLKGEFYTFLNRTWFGFAAFVRKSVFDQYA